MNMHASEAQLEPAETQEFC